MRILIGFIAVCALLCPITSYAENHGVGPTYLFPSDTRFISLYVGKHSLGGDDFEGTTFFIGGNTMYVVPDFNPGTAFGVALDSREKWYGSGFSYTRASYEWNWGGYSDVALATRHTLNADFRAFLLAENKTQPFVLAGLFANLLRIEDGKIDGASMSSSNSSMSGLGLDFGIGAEHYLESGMGASLGLTWHGAFYGSISGVELDEGLYASGSNYYLSIGWPLK